MSKEEINKDTNEEDINKNDIEIESIENRIFKRFENKITYTKKTYKTKSNFLKFCEEKNPYIKRYDILLKHKFNDMENMIEETLFIDCKKLDLLQKIKDHIVDKEELDIIENEEKIKKILERVKVFINNTLRSIKNNKKSILTIELAHQFFSATEETKLEIINKFEEKEKNYKELEDIKNFDEIFHETEILIDKVSKSLSKSLKAGLIFTIDDETLETKKDKIIKKDVNKEEIILRGKKCTSSLRKYHKTVKLLLECKFKDLEYRHIKTFLTNFYNEFSSDKNKFEEIFLFQYAYREMIANSMLLDTGKFLSLLFQKISALRTILFISYSKDNLFPEIEESLKKLKMNVDEGLSGLEMTNLTAFERELEKTLHYINFIISFLSSKKTYKEFFNNKILNDNIPSILENLTLYKLEANYLEREIIFFKEIFLELNNYNVLSSELKLEEFQNFGNERNLKFSDSYRKFIKSHYLLLKMLKTHYNGSAFKIELFDRLEENERNMSILFEKLYYQK